MKLFWTIALIFSLSVGFVACSDDDDDDNSFSNDYFTVENGTFVDKTIPSGEKELITGIDMNNSVITGGASLVTITSSEKLKNIYIGVKGVKNGYYSIPAVASELKATAASNTYEVVLQLSQSLKDQEFAVTISGETEDGKTSAAVNSDEIEIIEVGTGKLQISLSWNQLDDVDLHVFDADGIDIYYGNKFSPASYETNINYYIYAVEKYTNHNTSNLDLDDKNDLGTLIDYYYELSDSEKIKAISEYAKNNKNSINGYLDLDSNAGCGIDGINNENVTFIDNVPNGEYKIAVNLWSKCGYSNPGAKYTVSVNFNGKAVKISDLQTGKFTNSYQGNPDDLLDEFVYVGAFNINGNTITPVEIDDLKSSSLKRTNDVNINKLIKAKK